MGFWYISYIESFTIVQFYEFSWTHDALYIRQVLVSSNRAELGNLLLPIE